MMDPARVAAGVRAGDPAAIEELYLAMRFSSWRRFEGATSSQGRQNFEDRLHDCFVVVLEAVQTGKLRDPGALMGYASAVVDAFKCRMIAEITRERNARPIEAIRELVPSRARNPEQILLRRERNQMAERAWKVLSKRDREILRRFYFADEPWRLICAEMNLTSTQFRIRKSRAKAAVAAEAARLLKRAA